MVKKGKSGKKKGSQGKKKSKSGKKKKQPKATWQEALLAYKINLIERQIEEAIYELNAEKERNSRNRERNDHMKKEQLMYIANITKQAKDPTRTTRLEETNVDRDAVVTAMMNNWQEAKEEEQCLEEIHKQTLKIDEEAEQIRTVVDYWLEYKEKGLSEHQMQIRLLEYELVDLENTYQEMAERWQKTLIKENAAIEKETDFVLERTKVKASDKALTHLDKYSKQEIMENSRLLKEVEFRRAEFRKAVDEVEKMESENLRMFAEVLDCSVEDLKIAKNMCLVQFNDDENLEESSILDIDLNELTIASNPEDIRCDSIARNQLESSRQRRNKRIKETLAVAEYGSTREMENPSHEFAFGSEFGDDQFQNYLRLGPLELKLLSLNGRKMSVRPITPHTECPSYMQSDSWPITKAMLWKALQKYRKESRESRD